MQTAYPERRLSLTGITCGSLMVVLGISPFAFVQQVGKTFGPVRAARFPSEGGILSQAIVVECILNAGVLMAIAGLVVWAGSVFVLWKAHSAGERS